MKKRIITVSSKGEKSIVSCANNQQCLFNHSVSDHDGTLTKFGMFSIHLERLENVR